MCYPNAGSLGKLRHSTWTVLYHQTRVSKQRCCIDIGESCCASFFEPGSVFGILLSVETFVFHRRLGDYHHASSLYVTFVISSSVIPPKGSDLNFVLNSDAGHRQRWGNHLVVGHDEQVEMNRLRLPENDIKSSLIIRIKCRRNPSPAREQSVGKNAICPH